MFLLSIKEPLLYCDKFEKLFNLLKGDFPLTRKGILYFNIGLRVALVRHQHGRATVVRGAQPRGIRRQFHQGRVRHAGGAMRDRG